MSGAHDHAHHDHGHGHGHAPRHAHGHAHGGGGHAHAPRDFGKAFAIGAALNIAFVIIEAIYGFISHSVALLSDAGHNLGDVAGLLLAWGAVALARRSPSTRFTYGLSGSTILAALANSILLLVATGAIALEAVQRLTQPEPVATGVVIVVALAGIGVNGVTAALFAAGRARDLNIRGVFTHMLADAAISGAVVVGAIAIMLTGWQWIDPALSLVIGAVIVWGAWGLLREALGMSLDAVPSGVDPVQVRGHLSALPGVARLHDLHIWSMSTTEIALTCHLVMPGGHPGDDFIVATAAALRERFGISHATLQIETDTATVCALEPEHVV